MRYFCIIVLLLAAFSVSLRAQFRPDTTVKQDTQYFVMTKDPILALGLSAVLPGAGQVYNGEWWKSPFIIGGIGACIYGAVVQNGRYQDMTDSVRSQSSRGDLALAARYESAREFFRDDRDKFYIYAGLVYVANLLDAYIAAHLFDFDVSDSGTIPFLSAPLHRDDSWRLGVRLRL